MSIELNIQISLLNIKTDATLIFRKYSIYVKGMA